MSINIEFMRKICESLTETDDCSEFTFISYNDDIGVQTTYINYGHYNKELMTIDWEWKLIDNPIRFFSEKERGFTWVESDGKEMILASDIIKIKFNDKELYVNVLELCNSLYKDINFDDTDFDLQLFTVDSVGNVVGYGRSQMVQGDVLADISKREFILTKYNNTRLKFRSSIFKYIIEYVNMDYRKTGFIYSMNSLGEFIASNNLPISMIDVDKFSIYKHTKSNGTDGIVVDIVGSYMKLGFYYIPKFKQPTFYDRKTSKVHKIPKEILNIIQENIKKVMENRNDDFC